MKKINVFLSVSGFVFVLTLFLACSSGVKKADIPSTANPQQEISKLDEDLKRAASQNRDVLAPSEYKKSAKWLDEAKSDLASAQDQEEVLDDVRTGRGYLDKAYEVSADREARAPGLFEARQAALKAGAGTRPELRDDLRRLDSEVADDAEDLGGLSAEDLSLLQARYVNLERSAVILAQVGDAQAILEGAKNDGAARKAPDTFKKTELSIHTAETIVATNVRNPDGFRAAVAQANDDASILKGVMDAIKQDKGLSESSALKLVFQNRRIDSLVTAEASAQEQNRQLASDLETTAKDLNAANANIGVQQALERARAQFPPEEAEAYQQGDSLLIRLKNINFASGRSDLPAASLPSLAKVSEVAKSLNASEIKVEGHTDSVGGESQNQSISEQRAKAVAEYFKSHGLEYASIKSEGHGFQKPIASNKSKVGRAQNRRVDILITPSNDAKTSLE